MLDCLGYGFMCTIGSMIMGSIFWTAGSGRIFCGGWLCTGCVGLCMSSCAGCRV